MITLKPFTNYDKEALVDILINEQVKQTYMLPDFEEREAATPLFEKLLALSQDPKRFVRGIYYQNTLVGFLNDVEIHGKNIELGYVIHPQYQSKGYMTQALTIAIGALSSLGYEKIIAGAFEENVSSIRVMQKCGMTLQPQTEEIPYRDKNHLCVYYAIHTREVET